jgi:predicted nucleic acid-binding protein
VIVVDASVLTDALVDDGPVGESARAHLRADPQWAAPAHLLVEVVAAIRGKVLGGKLAAAQLVDRMWELRANLTAHDAAYAAAAEALDCPLVTGDARLAKASGIRCEVRVL